MSKKQTVLAKYLGEAPKSLVPTKWDSSVFEVRPYTQYASPSPEQAIELMKRIKDKLIQKFGEKESVIETVEAMLLYGESKRQDTALLAASKQRFITWLSDEKTDPHQYRRELAHNQQLYEWALNSFDCRPYMIAYNALKIALSGTEEQDALFSLLDTDRQSEWNVYAYRQAYNGWPIDTERRPNWPANHGEYMVLTEREADRRAAEYILDSLWAFNPDFLANYLRGNLEPEMIKGIQEACEDANPALLALLKNKKKFVADAIRSDGRGHFLNTYDGEEHEFEGYYIYRMN